MMALLFCFLMLGFTPLICCFCFSPFLPFPSLTHSYSPSLFVSSIPPSLSLTSSILSLTNSLHPSLQSYLPTFLPFLHCPSPSSLLPPSSLPYLFHFSLAHSPIPLSSLPSSPSPHRSTRLTRPTASLAQRMLRQWASRSTMSCVEAS